MAENKLNFGVSLYSLARYFHSGKLDLEGLVKKAKEIGFSSITMVASQHCDEYPYPTDAWLFRFRDILEKYEMIPICWEAYLDLGMRNDRPLTREEIQEFTRNDIIYAYKAGFRMVKTQHAITPEIFESMLPLCERLGVKLNIEMHHPHHPQVPVWRDHYIPIMEKSGGLLGICPDTGIFQKYPHELLLRQAYEQGCRKDVFAKALEIMRVHAPESELDKLDLNAAEQDYAHGLYEKFNPVAVPAQLEPLLKYAHMIHGKFYYLADDKDDPCIPYSEIMPVIKKAGYSGHLIAEYEGHHYTDIEDEVEQLHRFLRMVKRQYAEA